MDKQRLIRWTDNSDKSLRYGVPEAKWVGFHHPKNHVIELRTRSQGCNILVIIRFEKPGRTRSEIKAGISRAWKFTVTMSMNGKSRWTIEELETYVSLLKEAKYRIQQRLKIYQIEGNGFRREAWLDDESEYTAQGHR